MSELGFWKLATANPDHTALVTPDGTRIKAGDLLARSNQLVHGLRKLGLQQGDVVATLLPNGGPMIEMYLAATQAGLYLVPINHHLAGPEIAYILSDSAAKAFVADGKFTDIAKAGAAEAKMPTTGCFAVGAIPGFQPYAALTDGMPTTAPADRAAGQVMNYTSGTTGRPKGVRRSLMPFDPDTVGSMFAMFLAMFGITPQDNGVHLVGSPLYHTAVLVFAGCSLHFGHTLSVMDKWTPEDCLKVIQRDKVTTTHMVPTQFHRLLALPDDVKKKYDVSSLRNVVHAAAPCPVDVKRRMIEWWGATIFEYYAASEGGGTLVTPGEWLERPGTVGKAWPSSEIRILDDAGGEIPTGTPGTVYMKLGVQDFEYHGDKKKTDANRRDGFFTVGDVGYLDDAGYLFLCDRKIDMIISGGANIYPSEIEACLLSHPKVGDAAVFGIPDDDWGESVKAVIEPAAGVTGGKDLADEIVAFCLERIAKFKVPKSIDFMPELPRDPNGKLYKRKLRDPYWVGRERAISLQIGLNLPVMAPGLDRDLIYRWCRGIDEGPFSCLAVGERINFPNPELTVTLSAAAAWTSRVQLFYNVLVLPTHPAARAAKQVATLDVISNGRVVLGVGVGAREDDYDAVGAPWQGRLATLERQVQRMRALWAGEPASALTTAPVEPKPVQPGGPKVLMGALFPRAITRAAHFADGILGFSFTLADEELGYAFSGAREAWKAAGRSAPPRLVTGCWFALGPNGRQQMDDYLGNYLSFLGSSAAGLIPLVPTTSADGLRAAVQRARDHGADEIVLAPTTLDPDEIKRVEDLLF